MTGTVIETSELRLLSHIIALVLDEQPGQAAAALDALRRRASSSRVTGGALKNLFDRLAAEDGFAPAPQRRVEAPELRRLQQDLDAALVQGSRLAAENNALHHRLAEAERRLRNVAVLEWEHRHRHGATAAATLRMPEPPARHRGGVLAGMLLGLLAMALVHDQGAPPPNRHGLVKLLLPAPQPMTP